MSDDRQTDSDYPQQEAEKRRDDLLRKLLHTPPKQRPRRERGGPDSDGGERDGAKRTKPKRGETR